MSSVEYWRARAIRHNPHTGNFHTSPGLYSSLHHLSSRPLPVDLKRGLDSDVWASKTRRGNRGRGRGRSRGTMRK